MFEAIMLVTAFAALVSLLVSMVNRPSGTPATTGDVTRLAFVVVAVAWIALTVTHG